MVTPDGKEKRISSTDPVKDLMTAIEINYTDYRRRIIQLQNLPLFQEKLEIKFSEYEELVNTARKIPKLIDKTDPVGAFVVRSRIELALQIPDDGTASFWIYSGQRIIETLMEPVLTQIRLRNIFEVTFARTERKTQAERYNILRETYPQLFNYYFKVKRLPAEDGDMPFGKKVEYATGAIESIGLPATVEMDGINGLKVSGMTADGSGYDMSKSSSFGFAPLMAATWNEELLYEVGAAFGQESLQHGINGWYAPAINLHRSVFSGRVFEYYSEDPLLSGVLAASAISGAGDQGMFSYVKHFALNDTETGRSALCSNWADEQTMRELYLKAFEIAVEDAVMTINYISDDQGTVATKTMRAATAIMPAQNRIGTTMGHCNYNLLTNVLRGEWGFQGMVVSDYWVWDGNNLRDLCIRIGCDTYLSMHMPMMWSLEDYDSATARSSMRNAIHNIAYTVANSNAMQGVAPGGMVKTEMSPWVFAIIGVDVIAVLILALGIFWIVKRAQDEKVNPDKYKPSIKKSRKKKSDK